MTIHHHRTFGLAVAVLLLIGCKRDESELPALDESTLFSRRSAALTRAASAPVVPASPNPGSYVAIEWSTQGRSRVSGFQSEVVRCPPSGRAQSVWGTDIYTNDSSICTAAVHAGVITMDVGGPVRVTAVAGLGRYPGSRRNGVMTRSYGSWGGSFTVSSPAGR